MKLKIFGKLADIFHGNEYDLDSENVKSVSELKVKLFEKSCFRSVTRLGLSGFSGERDCHLQMINHE